MVRSTPAVPLVRFRVLLERVHEAARRVGRASVLDGVGDPYRVRALEEALVPVPRPVVAPGVATARVPARERVRHGHRADVIAKKVASLRPDVVAQALVPLERLPVGHARKGRQDGKNHKQLDRRPLHGQGRGWAGGERGRKNGAGGKGGQRPIKGASVAGDGARKGAEGLGECRRRTGVRWERWNPRNRPLYTPFLARPTRPLRSRPPIRASPH